MNLLGTTGPGLIPSMLEGGKKFLQNISLNLRNERTLRWPNVWWYL